MNIGYLWEVSKKFIPHKKKYLLLLHRCIGCLVPCPTDEIENNFSPYLNELSYVFLELHIGTTVVDYAAWYSVIERNL